MSPAACFPWGMPAWRRQPLTMTWSSGFEHSSRCGNPGGHNGSHPGWCCAEGLHRQLGPMELAAGMMGCPPDPRVPAGPQCTPSDRPRPHPYLGAACSQPSSPLPSRCLPLCQSPGPLITGDLGGSEQYMPQKPVPAPSPAADMLGLHAPSHPHSHGMQARWAGSISTLDREET